MTRIFGLTGGIACGKSTVARFWGERGLPIIDADQLARRAVLPGTPALKRIEAIFGPSALLDNGELNRSWLAEQVFHDEALKGQLNQIVHPEVARLFQQEQSSLSERGAPLGCYDVPLLFERGLESGLRPVVVVHVAPALQRERAVSRGLSSDQAEARIASQMPIAEKVQRADYSIDNSGSRDATRQLADQTLREVCLAVGVPPSTYGLESE